MALFLFTFLHFFPLFRIFFTIPFQEIPVHFCLSSPSRLYCLWETFKCAKMIQLSLKANICYIFSVFCLRHPSCPSSIASFSKSIVFFIVFSPFLCYSFFVRGGFCSAPFVCFGRLLSRPFFWACTDLLRFQ